MQNNLGTTPYYFCRVKETAQNLENNQNFERVTDIKKDFLEDSYSFASQQFLSMNKRIEHGLFQRELEKEGFGISNDTTFDIEMFLVRDEDDEELFLLSINRVDKKNLDIYQKLEEEQKTQAAQFAELGILPHKNPVGHNFFYRFKKNVYKGSVVVETLEEKNFIPRKDQRFLELVDFAHEFHSQQMMDLLDNPSSDANIAYELFIVENLEDNTEKETLRQSNFNMSLLGFYLELELKNKDGLESIARNKKLISFYKKKIKEIELKKGKPSKPEG